MAGVDSLAPGSQAAVFPRKNFLDHIASHPDDSVSLYDDDAWDFLGQIGLQPAFPPANLVDEEISESGFPWCPVIEVCGFDGIRTHFVIAYRFNRCLPPSENGFLVTCIPRSGLVPTATTEGLVMNAVKAPEFSGGRIIFRSPPSRN